MTIGRSAMMLPLSQPCLLRRSPWALRSRMRWSYRTRWENYLVVQTIYRGWDMLALVLALELASMFFMVVRYRRVGRVLWPTMGAVACVAAAQAVFWIWTYPANRLTKPEGFRSGSSSARNQDHHQHD